MVNRLEKIDSIITKKGFVRVKDLAQELNVSVMTIRRDLIKLENEGSIVRTHGGAYTNREVTEIDYQIRKTVRQSQKEAIGRKAYSMVLPGDSIFIDAGSTGALLAAAIDDLIRLTVVTYSIVVAQFLQKKLNVEVILLGGKLHSTTQSLIGPLTEEAIQKFKFSKAFLGTSGINLSEGLTVSTLEEITIKKQAALNSNQVIVLADSSKFNRYGLAHFLDFDQVDVIITDWELDATNIPILHSKGIQLIIADGDDKC